MTVIENLDRSRGRKMDGIDIEALRAILRSEEDAADPYKACGPRRLEAWDRARRLRAALGAAASGPPRAPTKPGYCAWPPCTKRADAGPDPGGTVAAPGSPYCSWGCEQGAAARDTWKAVERARGPETCGRCGSVGPGVSYGICCHVVLGPENDPPPPPAPRLRRF